MTIVQSLTRNGLGRLPDDVFVPRVLPGEDVDLADDGVVRILSPSVNRISPSCRHYKSCGGCSLQHASNAFTADWKREQVVRSLTARGIVCDVMKTDTSPEQSRRRVKFSGRRTKKGALVGFYQRASDALVAVPECILVVPELVALLPHLENLTQLIASRKETISLTVLMTLGGPDVAITTTQDPDERLRLEAGSFGGKAEFARLSWNGEVVVTYVSPVLILDTVAVVPPPGAFVQATAHGEAALQSIVDRETQSAKSVIDLFSGCGTFTFSAARSAEVHAVEGDATMLAALSEGWRKATNLKRVSTETRDLFRNPIVAEDLNNFDAAIIDPPRAGAEAQIAEIAMSNLPKVAMVSCNPITFARDAEALINTGFEIGPVAVVDQFRWSAHVEVAASFTRK